MGASGWALLHCPQGSTSPPLAHLPTPRLPRPPRPPLPLCLHRISSYCKGKGWQRIEDSRREDYKLKWCEVKCRDSYYSFREGSRGGAAGSGTACKSPPGPEPGAGWRHRPPPGEVVAAGAGGGCGGPAAPHASRASTRQANS